jgi:CRP-like cAMP-binding protein
MNGKSPDEISAKKQVLYGVSPLTGISDEAFGLLASMATESRVNPGHVIVHQGDLGTKLFIIARGEVRVLRQGRHGDVEVARMKEGDFFGEMCILEHLPRSASVQAVIETDLVLLSYAAFEVLFDKMPLEHHRVLGNIARALSARLRELGDEFALNRT